jgi:hypothetical protein
MKLRYLVLLLVLAAVLILYTVNPDGVEQAVADATDSIVGALRDLTSSEITRRLTLQDSARDAYDALVAAAAARGIEIFLASAGRSPDEQKAALAAGASSTSHSWHLLGLAVDYYVRDPETGKWDKDGRQEELYRTVALELAAPLGWGNLAFNADGSPRYLTNAQGKRYRDIGHLQLTGGRTWAQAANDLGYTMG